MSSGMKTTYVIAVLAEFPLIIFYGCDHNLLPPSLMEFTLTRAPPEVRRSLISGSDSPSGSISITLQNLKVSKSFTEGIRTVRPLPVSTRLLACISVHVSQGNMLRTHGLRLFILYLNPNQALLTGAWGVEPRTYICCQGNSADQHT